MGVVGVKSYSRRRHNDKALSAPFDNFCEDRKEMSDIKTENIWLMKGDCLERMKEIPIGSVEMVLTDAPHKCNCFGVFGYAFFS